MTEVRIIRHEESFEVQYPDGPSVYFYFDDNAGRRSITRRMDRQRAEAAAKKLARAERGTVWAYRYGDDGMEVFATPEAACAWFEKNDPEGVAWERQIRE